MVSLNNLLSVKKVECSKSPTAISRKTLGAIGQTNKMSMTKIQIFILTFLTVTFFSCGFGLKKRELKSLVDSNKDSLQIFCNDFLKQSEIRNICIAASYDKNQCDVVNSWCLRFKNWETWSEEKKSTIYLKTLDEVLADQKISKTTYNNYSDFLKRHNLKSISKVWNCETCVDLEYDLDGLRYSQDNKYQLKQDNEYLSVEQINPHWTFYHRDWN